MEREADFFEQLAEDSRPALMLFAVGLLISGAFAVFLSARREFLPHDVAFLGMTATGMAEDGGGPCRAIVASVRTLGIDRTGLGMMAAGTVILFLGTTDVFVVEDLAYMGLTREMLQGMNPRLVPLIAHDRAGFGGGLATTGLLVLFCALHARPPEPIIPPGHTAGSRLVRFQARARVTVAIEYASARGNR